MGLQPAIHQRDHAVGVDRRRRGQRLDPPLQAHRALHVQRRHERVDRHPGTLGGQQPRGAPGLRVARDRDHPEIVDGDRGGGVGHGRPLARCGDTAPAPRGTGRPLPRRRPRSSSRPRPTRTGSRRPRSRPTASRRRRRRARRSRRRWSRRGSGRGAWIIDSSIWVATIAGRPAARAARTSSFWIRGICSIGSSTPRSPRAIISASASARMPSTFGHGGPGLDLGHDRHGTVPHRGAELAQIATAPARTTAPRDRRRDRAPAPAPRGRVR